MSYAKFPEIHYQIKGMEDIRLRMVRIRQLYDRRRIEDLAGWTRRELEEKLSAQLKGSLSGKRICITAGSRGIPHIVLILRTVVDWLRKGRPALRDPGHGQPRRRHGGGAEGLPGGLRSHREALGAR